MLTRCTGTKRSSPFRFPYNPRADLPAGRREARAMPMTPSRPFLYGLGKRKTAIAKIRLFQDGGGKCTINGNDPGKYFFSTHTENAFAPLRITDTAKKVDVDAIVMGGGKPSQSDAIRLGLSRALILMDPTLRSALKQAGFLRRDSRIKERKKPGLKRARRAPQFSKR